MLRLVTEPLGKDQQAYRWDRVKWKDGVATNIEGLSANWSLILVRHFHGGKSHVRERPIVVAISGPYKGAHLAWMGVKKPGRGMLYIQRLFPVFFKDGPSPVGRFALALARCVEGCDNPDFCSHSDERMMDEAEEIQRQLFRALDAGFSAAKPERTTITQREEDVVVLIEAKLSNRQIARRLFLTVSAVERHITNAMRTAGVKNRHELVAWWKEQKRPRT